MAQVPETIQNPGNAIEVQEHSRAVSRVINGDLTFGDPSDRVGGGANGRKDNMSGAWVSMNLAAADFYVEGSTAGAAVRFEHNLNAPTAGIAPLGTPSRPNVIWFVWGKRTATTHGPMDLIYRQGDAITANYIDLRPIAGDDAPTGVQVIVWFQAVGPW